MNNKRIKLFLATFFLSISTILLFSDTIFASSGNNTWNQETPLPNGKSSHTSEVINDMIYVIGGHEGNGIPTDKLEILNTKTNTWSLGAPKNIPVLTAASAVIDGKIYVFGGLQNISQASSATNIVEIYDPKSNSWSYGASMPNGIYGSSAIAFDSKIYLIGGVTNTASFLQNIWVYDTKNNTWSVGANLPRLNAFSSVEIFGDKIYMIGGFTPSNGEEGTTNVSIYDISANSWSSGTPMPNKRFCSTSEVYGHYLYIFAGCEYGGYSANSSHFYNDVLVYDILKDTWTNNNTNLTQERFCLTSNLIDDKVYVLGGFASGNTYSLSESLKLSDNENRLFVLLREGERTQLSISYYLPDNIKLTWTSFSSSTANVTSQGLATATSVGTTYIIARDQNGNFVDYIPVKVIPYDCLAVYLLVGENLNLYLDPNPANVNWISLDPNIATISTTGQIKAISKGLVIIKGELRGKEYFIYVRVNSI